MKPLLLVDGNALACRVFYGGGDPADAPDVISAAVASTGGPWETVWCFDGARPYFRTALHPAYKATRTAHPDGYSAGLERLRAHVGGISVASFEADDVIATLAAEVKRVPGARIATTDKDLLQLHDPPWVTVWRPTSIAWDADDPVISFGVRADQVVDFLALLGDSTDNVPGVPGVGKVKARNLLEKHGSLEAVIQAGAIRAEFVDSALLSRELVRLRTDVPIAAVPS